MLHFARPEPATPGAASGPATSLRQPHLLARGVCQDHRFSATVSQAVGDLPTLDALVIDQSFHDPLTFQVDRLKNSVLVGPIIDRNCGRLVFLVACVHGGAEHVRLFLSHSPGSWSSLEDQRPVPAMPTAWPVAVLTALSLASVLARCQSQVGGSHATLHTWPLLVMVSRPVPARCEDTIGHDLGAVNRKSPRFGIWGFVRVPFRGCAWLHQLTIRKLVLMRSEGNLPGSMITPSIHTF